MATVQQWRKTRTPNVYVRESTTSPTGKLWKAYYPGAKNPDTGKPRQQTKTFVREAEAKAFLEEVHHRKITGTLTDTKKGRQTLRSLWDEYHAAKPFARNTLIVHRTVWNKVAPLAGTRIADIDGTTIDTVLADIEGAQMKEKARTVLSGVFAYAVDKRRINQNPARRQVRASTRQERMEKNGNKKNGKRYLRSEELVRLLGELPERYRVLVALMSSMGLRPGEAYALKVGKFDPETRKLLIDESADGFTKTGESRTLVLPPVVSDILSDHIERFSNPKDPGVLIFPTAGGVMIHDNNFRQRVFYPARDRAGIEGDLTPNSCRHTAVAFAIAHGANVYDVQQMVGHAKPSITLDVYGDLWEGSQERLAARQDEAIRVAWGPALRLIEAVEAPALPA